MALAATQSATRAEERAAHLLRAEGLRPFFVDCQGADGHERVIVLQFLVQMTLYNSKMEATFLKRFQMTKSVEKDVL
jgi:hypothetical protein